MTETIKNFKYWGIVINIIVITFWGGVLWNKLDNHFNDKNSHNTIQEKVLLERTVAKGFTFNESEKAILKKNVEDNTNDIASLNTKFDLILIELKKINQ